MPLKDKMKIIGKYLGLYSLLTDRELKAALKEAHNFSYAEMQSHLDKARKFSGYIGKTIPSSKISELENIFSQGVKEGHISHVFFCGMGLRKFENNSSFDG